MEKMKQLLKKGDDEFADFIYPYVTRYLGDTKIFDAEKNIKIFYVFEVFLSYLIESAQQVNEEGRTLKTAVGVSVVNSMFRMQGAGFLALSESDTRRFENFFHSKSFLLLQVMTEFFVGLNSGDRSFIEFIIATKSEKPKTFSECVCKVFAENWLKDTNKTLTQISRDNNDGMLQYKKMLKDENFGFCHADFALKSETKCDPKELSQQIEKLQNTRKEKEEEEQFSMLCIGVFMLLLMVLGLLYVFCS